jgi:hypothetical protein
MRRRAKELGEMASLEWRHLADSAQMLRRSKWSGDGGTADVAFDPVNWSFRPEAVNDMQRSS